MKALRDVPGSEDQHWIGRHRGRRWGLGQGLAIRPPESERAVRLSIDVVALLVDRAMVPATEQGEVRERRRAALSPVSEVMALAEADAAARKAATTVPVVKRSP